MTADSLTAPLRRSLNRLGYAAHPWQLGVNCGLRANRLQTLATHLKELVLRYSGPVTVIGWSLGGLYARSLANLYPECVRQVITKLTARPAAHATASG